MNAWLPQASYTPLSMEWKRLTPSYNITWRHKVLYVIYSYTPLSMEWKRLTPSYNITWRHKVLYVIYSYSKFTGANYLPISLASCDRPWSLDDFSYKNLGGGETRFHVIGTWSSCQKNLFSTISYMHQNFIWHIAAVMALARFRIVTHSYTASFSIKFILCETNNIFDLVKHNFFHKNVNVSWKFTENEGYLTVNIFRNYVYVSSYCHSKTFAWKRDCPKLHKLRLWARPFWEALKEFYMFH